MADEGSSSDQQQFEQVLSRLDALMKRGQAAVPPPNVPDSAPGAAESRDPFVVIEDPADIPVLTEVYDGTTAEERSAASAEALIEALLPQMLENLDLIVAEEAARMQQAVAERLRLEISAALRQRLDKKDY